MTVDKFGHHSRGGGGSAQKVTRVTFPHTSDGNINAENVKICNVKDPSENGDAATKKYVDAQINELRNIQSPLIQTHGELLQQKTGEIEGLAIGLNEVREELHKTTVPLLEQKLQKIMKNYLNTLKKDTDQNIKSAAETI
uniref:Uncharacterized protein LOC114349010 n=1 Tax=Diabrotica virgifera virgifera TaxID=50390 RepID=A0A6P7H9C5_DIAVI